MVSHFDVSLGAYSEVDNTYVHHIHTFLHTGSGLYNPLQHTHIVPRPHILYNISTTLYSLQLYSISTVYNLYNTPLHLVRPADVLSCVGRSSGQKTLQCIAAIVARAEHTNRGSFVRQGLARGGAWPSL